jgi:hypothetical protein
MDTSHVLLSLGYTQVESKTAKIILESTQKVLKTFGQSSYRELIDQLHSQTGMSELELIKNFLLFEDALKKSTGTVSAKIMIDMIKEELLKYTHLQSINYKIDEIISKVDEYSVYDFIRSSTSSEHILVLYKKREIMDQILHDFFSKKTQAPFGLISDFPTKIPDIRNITYHELFRNDRSGTIQKLSDWIDIMHSCNTSDSSTKIADEDGTWYIRNNLGAEHFKLESSWGIKPYKKMSILCAYDISKLPPGDLESLIKSHGYVILQNNSIVLYKSSLKN